ncbi:hypothetical protein QUB06_00350 [Microcoleus sp. D2_18a_D3]
MTCPIALPKGKEPKAAEERYSFCYNLLRITPPNSQADRAGEPCKGPITAESWLEARTLFTLGQASIRI